MSWLSEFQGLVKEPANAMMLPVMTRGERDIVQEAGDHVGRVTAFIASVRERLAHPDALYPEPETVTQPEPPQEQREPDSEP
jgi:hypothetical protein